MNKVVMLSVDWDGYYGGSVNEYCLLPIEWQGLYMSKLEEGEYEREIYLGEIAGKHSEVYGDLTVKIVDLDSLDRLQYEGLVSGSSADEFEGFFDSREEGYYGEVEGMEDYQIEVITYGQKALESKLGIDQIDTYQVASVLVHDAFIDKLKNKIMESVVIYVGKEDYEKAVVILNENGIEVLN